MLIHPRLAFGVVGSASRDVDPAVAAAARQLGTAIASAGCTPHHGCVPGLADGRGRGRETGGGPGGGDLAGVVGDRARSALRCTGRRIRRHRLHRLGSAGPRGGEHALIGHRGDRRGTVGHARRIRHRVRRRTPHRRAQRLRRRRRQASSSPTSTGTPVRTCSTTTTPRRSWIGSSIATAQRTTGCPTRFTISRARRRLHAAALSELRRRCGPEPSRLFTRPHAMRRRGRR